MIQFASVAAILPELVGILSDVVNSPETYEKLEGIRQLLCNLTGKEIDKAGLVALLEEVTQGEAYTGKWEVCDPNEGGVDYVFTRRLRVAGGWIYDVGRGDPILVHDKG